MVIQTMKKEVGVPIGPFNHHIVHKVVVDVPKTLVRIIQALYRGVGFIQNNPVVHIVKSVLIDKQFASKISGPPLLTARLAYSKWSNSIDAFSKVQR